MSNSFEQSPTGRALETFHLLDPTDAVLGTPFLELMGINALTHHAHDMAGKVIDLVLLKPAGIGALALGALMAARGAEGLIDRFHHRKQS